MTTTNFSSDVKNVHDTEVEHNAHILLRKIDKLLKSCEKVESKEIQKSITEAIQSLKRELDTVNEYCCKKYNVVFIGKCGAGKTTLICHWLDLLRKDVIGKSSTDITLLKSATGRTTAAEVIIEQTDKPTSIHIVPMSDDDIECITSDICNNIWEGVNTEKWQDEKNPNFKEKSSFHEEEKRLVLNMAKLSQDEANDLASKHSIGSFANEVLAKMNLNERIETDFVFDGTDFEKWMKETFEKINYGTFDKSPMPLKIIINVNKEERSLGLPPYIESVIDTRGLDSDDARPDLIEYIKSTNTICVLLDKVEAVPDVPICKLLQYCFQGQFTSRDDLLSPNCWKAKLGIYVWADDLEDKLAAVNQADDNAEKGEEIKKNEIRTKMINEKLKYNNENTLFIDVLSPYEMGKNDKRRKVIKYYAPNEVIDNRKIIFDKIESMRQSVVSLLNERNQYIWNELEKLSNEVDGIIQKKIVAEEGELNDIKELIKKNVPLWKAEFHEYSMDDVIDECLKTKHHQTIKAMTSRFGGNAVFHANLYDEIEIKSAPRIFDAHAKCVYKSFSEILRKCRDSSNRNRMSIIARDVSDLKSKYIEKFSKRLRKLFEEDVLYPRNDSNDFWVCAKSISGNGYTQRILKHYNNHINDCLSKINHCLREIAEEWVDCILKRFDDAQC